MLKNTDKTVVEIMAKESAALPQVSEQKTEPQAAKPLGFTVVQ